jgi:hypothetical protein
VTFKDGTNILGTVSLTASQAAFTTSVLALGSHAITAVYGGDASFQSSTSASLIQVVQAAATITAVSSSSNPSLVNQPVTFTATVSVVLPGSGTPTGTVTFKDGANALGTGTLAAGQATFTTSSLAAGGHSITAAYGGVVNFQPSASVALNQTITSQPPDFSIASNSASVSVVAGQSVNINLTITPTNGFTNPISFTCSGQPVGVGCSFNPQTVTPSGNGAPVTSVLTVSTTTSVASLHAPSASAQSQARVYGLCMLSGIAGLLLVGGRKPRQGRCSSLLTAGILCLLFAVLAGCGGRAQTPTPVSANIAVAATSGGVSHSTNLTVTITH